MKHKNEIEVLNYQTEKEVGEGLQSGTSKGSGKPNVYLIYDFPDQLSVKDLRKFLAKEGYFVLEPNFEGTLIDRRNKHENNLITADIILIYYGRENILWLRTKLLDILKSPGLGRHKPQFNSAVYVSQGVKFTAETVLNYQVALISATDIFPPKSLKEFLNQVRTSYAAVSE